MVGYKKLALIAAGAMAIIGTDAVAAPMAEPAFISYMSNPKVRWNRGAGFMMTFVRWSEDNPAWSVRNISWVEKYTGEDAMPGDPVMVYDAEANHGDGAWLDDRIPTWKRTNIPEPSTALLIGGAMGIMALRRRMA